MSRNLTKRAISADYRARRALGLFDKAADDLEAAAAEHTTIATEARATADTYLARAGESVEAANQASAAARRIRELTRSEA